MIEVRKRENEKLESLLRRFNRTVQDSGLLRTVKQKRFYLKPTSRRERREDAMRRIVIKKLKRYY